ncbi:hypothetical protein A2U01_0063344, partial [Trifolium medium]|nr:hypothetical protein [Trifolium medium]
GSSDSLLICWFIRFIVGSSDLLLVHQIHRRNRVRRTKSRKKNENLIEFAGVSGGGRCGASWCFPVR